MAWMCYCYFFLQKIYVVFEGHILLFPVCFYLQHRNEKRGYILSYAYADTSEPSASRHLDDRGKKNVVEATVLSARIPEILRSLRNHKAIPAVPLGTSSEGMGFEIVLSSPFVEPTVFTLVLCHTSESLPEWEEMLGFTGNSSLWKEDRSQ